MGWLIKGDENKELAKEVTKDNMEKTITD